MRSLFFALALLTATPALASDARMFETIYRGKAVDRAGLSWKSTVSLNFDSPDGRWYACSGVFIAQDVILTAAHCRIKDEGTVQIKLFKENSPSATIIYAEGKEFQYRAHPRYRKGAYDAGTDDIGVLVLKNARLPEDFLPNPILHEGLAAAVSAGRPVSVIGAGLNEQGTYSDRLYFASGTIDGYEAGDVMRIRLVSQGICGGDSGGPVFVRGGDGLLYLAALTSAVLPNLRGTCGSEAYANFLSNDRYRWAMSTAQAARELMRKAGYLGKPREISHEATATQDL